MQRVVWPLLHAYEKLPSGPQIWTVSPGHTFVSGASIEQVTLPHRTVAAALSLTTMASPPLTHGDWNVPSTLALLVCSPCHSAERLAGMTIVHDAPGARLKGRLGIGLPAWLTGPRLVLFTVARNDSEPDRLW